MKTLLILAILLVQQTHYSKLEALYNESFVPHKIVPSIYVDAGCSEQGAYWTISNDGGPMRQWGGYNVRRDRDGAVVHDCFNDQMNTCFKIPSGYSFQVGPYLLTGLSGEPLTLYITDRDGTRTGDSATITCGVLPAATPTPTPALTPTAIPPTPTPCPPFIDCQQPTPTPTPAATVPRPGPGF